MEGEIRYTFFFTSLTLFAGSMLVLVSSPTFNPNNLTGRKRTKNFKQLLEHKHKPLFNRALLGQYAPGSTFKLITGLIAMQEKALIAYTNYNCSGGYEYANDKTVACHEHTSPLSMKNAIAISCNSYFCDVFQKLFDKYPNTESAFNKWKKNFFNNVDDLIDSKISYIGDK